MTDLTPARLRRAPWRAAALAALAACGAQAGPPADAPLALTDVITGLGAPTDLAFLPDGALVVTEKEGAVRLRRPDGALTLAGTFDVDTRSEKGLLGVVADPDFARTRRLFFYYSASDAAGGTDLDRHRVAAVTLGADGVLDPASAQVLLRGLRGPANHDGGGLAVGPDGLLYVGVGDTGCNTGLPPEPPVAPGNYFATCLSNASGKILRIALDGSIPADNPLAATSAVTACGDSCGDPIGAALAPPRLEIWAWGLRNPWRFWFDPQTGRMWAGDVGEVSYEEIDVVAPGRHHGWPWREGAHGWPVIRCREVVPDTGDCVEPVYACRHGPAAGGVDGDCVAVVGGAIVDADTWPASERGRYYLADGVTGAVWSVAVTGDRLGVVPGSRRLVAQAPGAAVSLRPGPDGALYLAVIPGRVQRLGPR